MSLKKEIKLLEINQKSRVTNLFKPMPLRDGFSKIEASDLERDLWYVCIYSSCRIWLDRNGTMRFLISTSETKEWTDRPSDESMTNGQRNLFLLSRTICYEEVIKKVQNDQMHRENSKGAFTISFSGVSHVRYSIYKIWRLIFDSTIFHFKKVHNCTMRIDYFMWKW